MTELKDLIAASVAAVRAGMEIVRTEELHPLCRGGTHIKADGSNVTDNDPKVEEVMHDHLREIPGIRFIGEEGTRSGDGELCNMIDPIDGTIAHGIRASTSTNICCAVDTCGRVLLTVIGHPATGRIWLAEKDGRTLDVSLNPSEPRHVWDGTLDRKSVVMLDSARGFKRDGARQILSDAQTGTLVNRIRIQANLQMYGSNGFHMALVANGSDKAAGQITVAVGGPWDLAGVLLVLNAGGAARGFSMQPNGLLQEEDPLQITHCDIMVSGNSPTTVDELVRWLKEATA